MSVDLQVVFPELTVPLSSVSIVPNSNPVSLLVIGEDFTAVDSVYINDNPSPGFAVLSKTRLVAQVPVNLKYFMVDTVRVTSRALRMSRESRLLFKLGIRPQKVVGIQKLVQLFVKVLFTTPKNDIFVPRLGAAALRNLGQSFASGSGDNVIQDFTLSVGLAKQQLIAVQSRELRLPPSERLLNAKVVGSRFDRQIGSLDVTVELLSQAGELATVGMTL